jgi:hypothetical protein
MIYSNNPFCLIPSNQSAGSLLISATTARWALSDLRLMLHVVHDLNEGHGLSILGDNRVGRSLNHGSLHIGSVALAAGIIRLLLLLGLLSSTSWLITDELTLGTSAESRLLALPVTLGLLTHRSTLSLRSSTSSSALSWGTDSLTLGAVSCLTEILRATNIALWLITVDLTGSTRSLLTMNLALGSLTDRVALSRAGGVITLPSALRMTGSTTIISLHLGIELHLHLALHLHLRREGSR